MDHFAMAGSQVQVYAHLFSLWHRSIEKIRTNKRFVAYSKAD